MKKLSIKEKAKAYDKALEQAKRWHKAFVMGHNYPATDIKVSYEIMFPELKESEDEKIRKELIDIVKKSPITFAFEDKGKVLAWLEKQGEQKVPVDDFKAKDWYVSKVDGKIRNIYYSVDKVEPKFKVGDWVVYNYPNTVNPIYEIIQIDRDIIDLKDTNGSYFQTTISELNCNYHLWNISDAKDGDVLSFNDGHGNDSIELTKSITDKKIEFWFYLTNGNRYEVFDGITPYTNLVSRENATPATKEQRDALMKAMADAGYTFDFKEKVLEEIEQKPAWSEEDEEEFQIAIDTLVEAGQHDSANWLKSLKDRYTWKPSDEQLRELRCVISGCSFETPILVQLEEDLKKLL